MPTYQYRCNTCHHEFEVFQSITEDPLTTCPECRGEVRRLISGGAGFLFKGSGFYGTDYRSAQYKADQRKDTPPGAADTASKSSDSSSKPAGNKSDSKGS